MSNAGLNQAGKVLHISGKAPTDKAGTSRYCQSDRIHWGCCSIGCGLGDKPHVTGRRCLPFGKAVDLVVMYQISDIMVTAHGMDKVVSSLTVSISITAYRNNYKIQISYLGANSRGNWSAVKGVEDVASDIVG